MRRNRAGWRVPACATDARTCDRQSNARNACRLSSADGQRQFQRRSVRRTIGRALDTDVATVRDHDVPNEQQSETAWPVLTIVAEESLQLHARHARSVVSNGDAYAIPGGVVDRRDVDRRGWPMSCAR